MLLKGLFSILSTVEMTITQHTVNEMPQSTMSERFVELAVAALPCSLFVVVYFESG